MFNPIEQERLCVVTVLVNTVKVRVLTEDGQTVPVQLGAQWSSASQMSAEVFEVSDLIQQSLHWLCSVRALQCTQRILTALEAQCKVNSDVVGR